MAKSAPAVTNTQPNVGAINAFIAQHSQQGHKLTNVGYFRDKDSANNPYHIYYCQDDHAILIA